MGVIDTTGLGYSLRRSAKALCYLIERLARLNYVGLRNNASIQV